MKEKQEILKFLYELYQSYSEIDFKKNSITEKSQLRQLDMDSVDHIKVILCIEEEYQFEFSNEELAMKEINCMDDMAEFIMKHLSDN